MYGNVKNVKARFESEVGLESNFDLISFVVEKNKVSQLFLLKKKSIVLFFYTVLNKKTGFKILLKVNISA